MTEQLIHTHTPIKKKKKTGCFWWYLQGTGNTLHIRWQWCDSAAVCLKQMGGLVANVTNSSPPNAIQHSPADWGGQLTPSHCSDRSSNGALWKDETNHSQRGVEGTGNRGHRATATAGGGSGCATLWRQDPGVTGKLLVLSMWRSECGKDWLGLVAEVQGGHLSGRLKEKDVGFKWR